MEIKVIIATHKEYRMPQGKEFTAYSPMLVGSKGKESPVGYLRDDFGDNISDLNANFSELTGLYDLWKNYDVDIKGIVHYRRYFKTSHGNHNANDVFENIVTTSEIESAMSEYDAILPKKRNYYIESNESHYVHAHHDEPLNLVSGIIEKDYPEYFKTYQDMLKSTKAHMFNMFIMRSEYFDEYCSWLFDVLFKVRAELDLTGYSVQEARVFGFLSELLLDVWMKKNDVSFVEKPVLYIEKQHVVQKAAMLLKRKLLRGGSSHIKSSLD
jgi:hypothetical protein